MHLLAVLGKVTNVALSATLIGLPARVMGFLWTIGFICMGWSSPYTCKNPQVITKQQETWKQCCFNNLLSGCVRSACSQLVDKLLKACWQLATRLLSSTNLLQVVPITCYRPAIQQFVTKLRATATLYQLDKITALLQLVDNLVIATNFDEIRN
jgi:hypothetical protein